MNITDSFAKISSLPYGTKFYKADLHFHTPASEDARGSNHYGFNPYKIRYPKKSDSNYDQKVTQIQARILDSAKKVANDMVSRFQEEKLSLVAITDHNGIGTIWVDPESDEQAMDLAAPTWYELIDNEAQKVNASAGKTVLTILPGMEVSTDGVHLLTIFPPQFPRRKIHFMLCDLLTEIGFDINEWGRNPRVGTKSIFDTIELVTRKGGIPIIAHIDGSDQSLLKLYGMTSGAMKNVLLNKGLQGVEIVKPEHFSRRVNHLKKTVHAWMVALRKQKDLPPLALFQGSDAHDLASIAKRHTYVKMTEPSFSGLRDAMRIPSSRIRLSNLFTLNPSGCYLHSVDIETPFFKKQTFRFNRHLNCVTGKKGSGKSLLSYLIQAVGQTDLPLPKNTTVTLFVEKVSKGKIEYFAFRRDSKTNTPAFYQQNLESGQFQEIIIDPSSPQKLKELRRELQPTTYQSDRLPKIMASKDSLHTFLVKQFGKPTEKNIVRFNKHFSITRFLEEKPCQLMTLKNRGGQYELQVNVKWPENTISMKNFFSVNTSLKETMLISMIIIIDSFGPTIIDAPETHFDNEDIAKFLVPIIKQYKDSEQIILMTSNPLLSINTDPDNYIILTANQSGDKLKQALSGFGLDNKLTKTHLLNVIEGGHKSFQRRATRYI